MLQKERDKDESVHSNMLQYGMGSHYLDVVVADASLPLWRSCFKLDSIITDRESQYSRIVGHVAQIVNLFCCIEFSTMHRLAVAVFAHNCA
jgi:hypothetical protein